MGGRWCLLAYLDIVAHRPSVRTEQASADPVEEAEILRLILPNNDEVPVNILSHMGARLGIRRELVDAERVGVVTGGVRIIGRARQIEVGIDGRRQRSDAMDRGVLRRGAHVDRSASIGIDPERRRVGISRRAEASGENIADAAEILRVRHRLRPGDDELADGN